MLKFILYCLVTFSVVFVIDLAVFAVMQKIKKNKSNKNLKPDVAAEADELKGSVFDDNC